MLAAEDWGIRQRRPPVPREAVFPLEAAAIAASRSAGCPLAAFGSQRLCLDGRDIQGPRLCRVRHAGLAARRDVLRRPRQPPPLRPPVAMPPVVRQQLPAQRLLRRLLQPRINGGVHHHPLVVGFRAIAVVDVQPHHLGDVGRRELAAAPVQAGGDGLDHRPLVVLPCYGRLLVHPPQHQIAALQGPHRAVDGVARLRRLGDARQHGLLRQRQLVNVLAVVGVGGGLHPERVLAEGDYVQVEGENLLLAQRALHLQRQQHFAELAQEGALGLAGDILHQLHGDGGGPGADDAPVAHQLPAGVDEGHQVYAGVLPEALVLCIQEGALEVLRDLLVGQGGEPLAELLDELAVGGVDAQGRLQRHLAEGGHIRYLRVQVQEDGARQHPQERPAHEHQPNAANKKAVFHTAIIPQLPLPPPRGSMAMRSH